MFVVVVFLVLHAIVSCFTYYVFYVFLFWALVSGRMTLCVPLLLSLNFSQSVNVDGCRVAVYPVY